MYNIEERLDNICATAGVDISHEIKQKIIRMIDGLEFYINENEEGDGLFSSQEPAEMDFDIYSDRCEIKVGSTYFNVWSSGTSEAAEQFYSVVRAADKIKFIHVPHEECGDEEFDDDMDKMNIIFVVNFNK